MNTPTLTIEKLTSRALGERRAAFAEAITARHFELHPELEQRYGAVGREKCLQDAHFHLSYLAEAIDSSLPSLFADYVAWAKVMLEARGIPASDLARNLEVIRDVLREGLPAEQAWIAASYIEDGIQRLPRVPAELATHLTRDEPHAALAKNYLEELLKGRRREASRLILEAVDDGVDVRDIYLHVFQSAQREIGRLWQLNLLSVAQEHYCTAVTQLVMSQLYPRIFAGEKNGRTLVATCVSGDLHEIGVRMVSDFFEIEGWDTFYIGANAPVASVVQAVVEHKADVLAASATLTSHVRALKELVAAVRGDEECRDVKILVGGYPFNIAPELWRDVGADFCARDAREAVAIANRLVKDADGGEA